MNRGFAGLGLLSLLLVVAIIAIWYVKSNSHATTASPANNSKQGQALIDGAQNTLDAAQKRYNTSGY